MVWYGPAEGWSEAVGLPCWWCVGRLVFGSWTFGDDWETGAREFVMQHGVEVDGIGEGGGGVSANYGCYKQCAGRMGCLECRSAGHRAPFVRFLPLVRVRLYRLAFLLSVPRMCGLSVTIRYGQGRRELRATFVHS